MTDGRAGVEIILLVLLFTCIYMLRPTIGFGNKIYFSNMNLTFAYNELEEYVQI